MSVRPVSRDLVKYDPYETPTQWWCDRCAAYTEGPWHDSECPYRERQP